MNALLTTHRTQDELRRQGLFTEQDGIVRLPILLDGELIAPDDVDSADARDALGERAHAEHHDLHLLRQPRLDPDTGERTAGELILVFPRINDPSQLQPRPLEDVIDTTYELHSTDVFAHIDRIGEHLERTSPVMSQVAALLAITANTPAAFLDRALTGMRQAMSSAAIRVAVDRELAWGTYRGSALLDGWVDIDQARAPGISAELSGVAHGDVALPAYPTRQLRALPTRQLHITAGNSPVVPTISLLRALALKSPCLLKIPSGAALAGAALAAAVWLAGEHQLTQATSIVYWKGGDPRIEDRLFADSAWDRIVVWGAPGTVSDVRSKAGLTKTITFNPRYGVSLIGREALRDDLALTARRAAADALVWNQQACIASLIHYVEGTLEDAHRYATALSEELTLWEAAHPNPRTPDAVAAVRRARRGELRAGDWYSVGSKTAPAAAAVVIDRPFDLSQHPVTRVIAVRPVDTLEVVINQLSHAVSQVGIAPETRRHELRTRICATGVSAVLPLGEADTPLWAGEPHDSLRPLSELVSWVLA